MTLNPRAAWFWAVLLCWGAAGPLAAETVTVTPDDPLDTVFARLPAGTVVQFEPGSYYLTPKNYRDLTCGNCEAESTQVQATVGLRVSGERLWLLGPPGEDAIIYTNAGYGIYFDDCQGCTIEGLIVTGGERDPEPRATDGAIVARNSSLTVNNCVIRDNIGDSTLVVDGVVGIAGIVGRTGSVLTVRNNRILRNSWDGIVLYRNAQATIESNFIDGMDLARGQQIGGGRGVGIGITWNGYATIRGNVVRHYWKGIGAFVDAQVTAEDNVVEHIATWGLSLWDAGNGRPMARFRRNAIYDTGACGASISRELEQPPPGHLVQNVFVATGQDPRYDNGQPYCAQEAVDDTQAPPSFSIGSNVHYSNREPGGQRGGEDLGALDFRTRLQPILEAMDRWDMIKESDFWKEYGLEPEPVIDPGAPSLPDSLMPGSDSLGVMPDSSGVDTLLSPPDSSAADSSQAPPDTSGAPPDSSQAPPDTSGAPPDSTGGTPPPAPDRPDSARIEPKGGRSER